MDQVNNYTYLTKFQKEFQDKVTRVKRDKAKDNPQVAMLRKKYESLLFAYEEKIKFLSQSHASKDTRDGETEISFSFPQPLHVFTLSLILLIHFT